MPKFLRPIIKHIRSQAEEMIDYPEDIEDIEEMEEVEEDEDQ